MAFSFRWAPIALTLSASFLLSSCIHKKYETPITKDTQQPDKKLFDQAMKDIEHGRYETARITLNTLMNTYEASEFMAKSKLAVADSWYREGGPNGMAQAEAEYKDFELFYPSMEESAEAQNRICDIHYRQMDRSDRDWTQSLQAERECRAVLELYPNSKFAPTAAQRLRDIQESLAEHEFVVGTFYWKREMNPAAANRLNAVVDQYPLYSKAGEALFEAGDSYSKMGPRFRTQAGNMFSRIVREYPASGRADDAKERLQDLEMPVPQADPGALAREKYNVANYHKPGMMLRTTSWMRGGPDVSHSSKTGAPTMTNPKATIPASIPLANNDMSAGTGTGGTGTAEVSATPLGANNALDTKPDARQTNGQSSASSTAAANQPLPTNRDAELKKYREQQAKRQAKLDKKKKKAADKAGDSSTSANPQANSTGATPAAAVPNAGTPGAPPTAPQ